MSEGEGERIMREYWAEQASTETEVERLRRERDEAIARADSETRRIAREAREEIQRLANESAANANRADKAEMERDEARAEVARLRAELDAAGLAGRGTRVRAPSEERIAENEADARRAFGEREES